VTRRLTPTVFFLRHRIQLGATGKEKQGTSPHFPVKAKVSKVENQEEWSRISPFCHPQIESLSQNHRSVHFE
jgi:hypothetical protein